MNKNYDLIGDIHGHANELIDLLEKMDYSLVNGVYHHPERTVIFLGDYIDRGPQIRETLRIVKSMVDAGNAFAIMGNHEYNALAYSMKDEKADYIRRHSEKNVDQHKETLEEFKGYETEWKEYLEWFTTLPLFLELDKLRAVHACWDSEHIEWLKKNYSGRLTKELLITAHNKSRHEYHVFDETLKGKEFRLLDGKSIRDELGVVRHEARLRWWAKRIHPAVFKDIFVSIPEESEHIPVEFDYPIHSYPPNEKPVFFGHYWLRAEHPYLQAQNVCCLDYSVAKKGMLVAYRFNGEKELTVNNFIYNNTMQSV
jgi:hypothetical protein